MLGFYSSKAACQTNLPLKLLNSRTHLIQVISNDWVFTKTSRMLDFEA